MQMNEPGPTSRLFWRSKHFTWMAVLFASLLFLMLASALSAPAYAASATTSTQSTYIDQKLGFSLQLPTGWKAAAHPGLRQTANSDVVFTNPALPGTRLQIGVMRSLTAAADFAQRGKPSLQIGSYPAFRADVPAMQQDPIPCLVRIMLAGNDTVIGEWCALDASQHAQAFEGILATYRSHGTSTRTAQVMAPSTVNPVVSCAQDIANNGITNPPAYPWGRQDGSPNDSQWSSYGTGASVCDNFPPGYPDGWPGYLFQCTELANRFINEQWGLNGINGNAGTYYDYYSNGTRYNGNARVFGNQVQLTDDDSQGNNSAPPVPGDLLVFQDVNNASQGWTSGLNGTGHVTVVTSVTSSTVYVAQQNWSPTGGYWSFSLQHLSNGYHIVDNSGWSGRITRGWIHFTANVHGRGSHHMPGFSSFGSNVYQLHNDGSIWLYTGTPMTGWQMLDGAHGAVALAADGNGTLYELHGDGQIWKWQGGGSWQQLDINPATIAITANGNGGLYQLHNDGTIWRYTGPPISGWQKIDNNPRAIAVPGAY